MSRLAIQIFVGALFLSIVVSEVSERLPPKPNPPCMEGGKCNEGQSCQRAKKLVFQGLAYKYWEKLITTDVDICYDISPLYNEASVRSTRFFKDENRWWKRRPATRLLATAYLEWCYFQDDDDNACAECCSKSDKRFVLGDNDYMDYCRCRTF